MSPPHARRTAGALLAAALLSPAPAARAAPDLPEVQAEAALRGLARAGGAVELRLRLSSPSGGTFRLETLTTPPLRARVESAPDGAPHVTQLPVRVGVEPHLPLVVRGPDDVAQPIELPLDLAGRGERRVAWATERDASGVDPGARLVWLAARDLPRVAPGFDPVDAVAIDAPTLRRLDAEQRSALDDYLRGCGRVLALGLPAPQSGALRAEAGCGGRLLARSDSARDAGAALRSLLETPRPDLPRSPVLAALLPDAGAGAGRRAVVGWLAACGVVLLLALRATERVAWLLPLPVLLGALVWAVFRLTSPTLSSVVWLEAAGGDRHARVAVLLQAEGFAPGELGLAVPARLAPPVASQGPPAREWRAASAGSEDPDWRVVFDTHLLATHVLELRGVVPWRPPLDLARVEGRPRVTNPGAATSPAGHLSWQGDWYAVPALAPGGSWSPGEPADAAGDALASALRAVPPDEPALLLPLRGAELHIALAEAYSARANHATGWLLLRTGSRP